MSKKLYFRTRGGPTQGWGNIFRLASFADYCRDRENYEIIFFLEGPAEAAALLNRRGFRAVPLAEDIPVQEEDRIFGDYPKADVLIMEMLGCFRERQAMLKEHAGRLVVFDDLMDHTYCADLVVCGQALPGYGNREISDTSTRFLVGYQYFIFGPAYMGYLDRRKTPGREVRRILVAFGGGRYDAAYIKTAHALSDLSGVEPVFVLGYADNPQLKNQITGILPNAEVTGGVDNMDELLFDSDVAVVSAGYLKLESAITQTPAVMIATQWHQIPLAEEFAGITGAPYVGYMGFVTPSDIRDTIRGLMPQEARRKLAERFSQTFDGLGIERVYSAIFDENSDP